MNKKYNDVNCPYHGTIKVRGKLIEGEVIKKKSLKTAQVLIEEHRFIPKYERYIKLRHKYSVHCPDCLNISVGDRVLCGECRKISKTKSFVILKKLDSQKKEKIIKEDTINKKIELNKDVVESKDNINTEKNNVTDKVETKLSKEDSKIETNNEIADGDEE